MVEELNIKVSFEQVIPLKILKAKAKAKAIILGLHGYAQMADNITKHLDVLAKGRIDYCSLQAPHIFTTPNKTHVSTWMNSINREAYVQYQVQYFDELQRQLDQYEYEETVKIGFGFSQGASSLYRMVFMSKIDVRLALIYAGDIPPEIKELPRDQWCQDDTKFVLIHGAKDNIMSAEKVNEDYEWLKDKNFDVEMVKYAGNHNVESAVLESLSTYIEKVL